VICDCLQWRALKEVENKGSSLENFSPADGYKTHRITCYLHNQMIDEVMDSYLLPSILHTQPGYLKQCHVDHTSSPPPLFSVGEFLSKASVNCLPVPLLDLLLPLFLSLTSESASLCWVTSCSPYLGLHQTKVTHSSRFLLKCHSS
jgi:hypothetical protein